jgi:hypothetical protein
VSADSTPNVLSTVFTAPVISPKLRIDPFEIDQLVGVVDPDARQRVCSDGGLDSTLVSSEVAPRRGDDGRHFALAF